MEEQAEQAESESKAEQREKLKATLVSSPEGRLLLAGAGLAFIYSLWLGVRVLLSPDESQVLVGMTATQIMFGRAAGMAFGYSLGLGQKMVIPICMILETIMVLVLFPLFVFSWRHLLIIKGLKKIFERMHRAAESRKGLVHRYGIIGLFIFVWFPFWMTGPVIGCVIGFLLGLKVRVNIPVVLGGTYAAIFGWVFFLRHFHDHVASYSSYAAMALMGLLVIIIILGHFLHRTLRENREKE